MPDGDSPLRIKAQFDESELVRLNERIARLALSLGVPLDTELDQQRLLSHEETLFSIAPGHADSAQHQHKRRDLETLRGLLVMRCDLMTNMLHDLGLDVTFEIGSAVEEWLQRQGFKPGADGFLLLQRLREAQLSASSKTPPQT